MTLSFEFAPDPNRAARLDARMHAGLYESLDHILDKTSDLSDFQRADVAAVATGLRAGDRYGPAAFGRYYELVFALLNKRYKDAVAASVPFADLQPCDGTLQIVSLDPLVIGDDAALFRRRMGPEGKGHFLPLAADAVDPYRQQLEAAIAIMDRALPELAGEFHALIRQIVLTSDPEDSDSPFPSASAYMLWGLAAINPKFVDSLLLILEVLVHETAHMLLFGFTYDEALVLNDDAIGFTSPLRDDPRPMDGVYHAVFVTARVHLAMAQLAASTDIDPALRTEAAGSLARHTELFYQGLATVEADAKLSETGAALLAGAKAYMDEAA